MWKYLNALLIFMFQGESTVRNSHLHNSDSKIEKIYAFHWNIWSYPLLVPEWQTRWGTCLFQSGASLTPGLHVKTWWTSYSQWRIFSLMKSIGQNLKFTAHERDSSFKFVISYWISRYIEILKKPTLYTLYTPYFIYDYILHTLLHTLYMLSH